VLIVIDGYNFIFAVCDLEKYIKDDSIENARERFISLLVKYKSTKKYRIVVVFDSSNNIGIQPARQEISGLEIVYAHYSKDADTVIKEMIADCKHPRDTCVVTNDNDIKMYVKRKGSSLLSPEELYEEIINSLGMDSKTIPKEPMCKFHGPSESETRYWLKIFKEGDQAEKDIDMDMEKYIDEVEVEVKVKPDIISDDSIDGEPYSKFLGTPEDETDYWLKYFEEGKEDDK